MTLKPWPDATAGVCRRWVLTAALVGAATTLPAQTPPSRPGSPSTGVDQRQRLLDEGEALLAAGDTASAEQKFDQAALLLHAGDTEVALVRTYMQAGDYRRALSFGAHAAGAHRDEPGATALYAWLLHLGGQAAVAARLLDQARAEWPDDRDVQRVRAAIAGGPPIADRRSAGVGRVRLAPYATPAATPAANPSAEMPATASTAGSGVLVGDGGRAVAPAALLRGASRVWVRNGLGQTVGARLDRSDADSGIAVLRLAAPLVPCPGLVASPSEPFAGSPAAMVDYGAFADSPGPAWPLLRPGFFGRRPAAATDVRPLGIEAPPGPLGGPVFDASGRLAGVASAGADGVQQLVGSAALAQLLGEPPAPQPPDDRRAARIGLDSVYECALRVALQLIVQR